MRGVALWALVVCVGCSRAPIPDYVDSKSIAELPEAHQKQIRERLKTYFGTTAKPWLHQLPDEAELDAVLGEAVEAAATGEGASDAAEGVAEEADAATESASPELSAEDKAARRARQQVVRERDMRLAHGAEVYRLRCAGCHGVSGDGNGPAAPGLQPKPRDYRRGIYKFTSTPYGAKPVRQDLVRTIRRGAKGTSMPAFPWMSEEDLEALIDYVILLSQRGELEEYMSIVATDEYEAEDEIPAEDFEEGLLSIREAWQLAEEQVVLPVTARPQYTAESVELGRQAFMTQGCAKCHGENGKGQTDWLSAKFLKAQEVAPPEQKIEINYDAWGHPAPAADLTARMLHGGRRPVDIYRRIYTGINGTPMPAFDQAFTEKPETLWHLVHFILSVVEGSEVQALESAPAGKEVASATGR